MRSVSGSDLSIRRLIAVAVLGGPDNRDQKSMQRQRGEMRTIKGKKRSLRWLSAFMALGLLAAACGDDDDSSNSNGSEGTGSGGDVEDIRILVTVPLTGDSAETGEDMVHGAELAAEYLNEQGGVTSGPLKGAQFVIESADDEMSTEASTTLASRYVDDDGIWTMTGFLSSGQAQAAALVANRAGLSVFSSFSCADFLTTEADNIVVVCGSLQNIARAATDFAVTEFDPERVGTIAGDYSFLESYYTGVDEQLKLHEVDLATRQTYPEGTADFSTLLTNLESANIDVILTGAFQADSGRILSQARQAGMDIPYVDFLGEGWGETFFDTAGKAASDNAYIIDAADTSGEASEFVLDMSKRFQEAYGKRMPGAAMHTFDSVLSIHAAIEAGAESREDLIEFITKAKGSGLLGPIEFTDELRPVSRVGVMYKVTGTSPDDREIVARYDLRGDETVERTE